MLIKVIQFIIKLKIFYFHYPHIPFCNFQNSVSEKNVVLLNFSLCVYIPILHGMVCFRMRICGQHVSLWLGWIWNKAAEGQSGKWLQGKPWSGCSASKTVVYTSTWLMPWKKPGHLCEMLTDALEKARTFVWNADWCSGKSQDICVKCWLTSWKKPGH